MKGDGDGWYLRCCTRRRRPTRCQFLLCLFTRESPFGGVCIHMQYIIHGLYFMKRNNEKDRFMFPWCCISHAQRNATQRNAMQDTQELHSKGYACNTSPTFFPSLLLTLLLSSCVPPPHHLSTSPHLYLYLYLRVSAVLPLC